MPRISLRATTTIMDRPMKEIDLTDLKLTHRIDQNAVMHLFNDKGTVVVSLSPSVWATVLHDLSAQPAR
jgi:hypothetical protein